MAADPAAPAGFISFWTTYGSVITGGAVVISAITAIVVLRVNRSIARRRATLDLILHIETDGDIIKARKAMSTAKKNPAGSRAWSAVDKRDSDEANAIRTILNVNEIVAVSIAEDIIDEHIYHRWQRGAYIEDYRSMEDYVRGVREYWRNPSIYVEVEKLVHRWEGMPAFQDRPGWLERKRRALRDLSRA